MSRAREASPASAVGHTQEEVARLLGLRPAVIRSFVREGFVEPRIGPSGEERFSFQDLVVLRAAKELRQSDIPPRRIRAALNRLQRQLPRGTSLAQVRISSSGSEVVVRQGDRVWNPESGQALFDFAIAELAEEVTPSVRRWEAEADAGSEDLTADDWHALGCELEITDHERALDAYRRALRIDDRHADAHLDLGRLLHQTGALEEALEHYRRAHQIRSSDATAAFNLGVALEDLERTEEALEAYEQAVEADPADADAHFNAARLCEALGEEGRALRHLTAYRRLLRGDG